MRNVRADGFCYLIAVLLFLAPFSQAAGNVSTSFRQCNTQKVEEQCRKNERCVQSSADEVARCQCLIKYRMVDGVCVEDATTIAVNATTVRQNINSDSGGSSVAAGLLIPTFLVVIGVLLYFGARRYKWLQRFRQFRQNRYGNVLVTRDDDDDDDPPIA